MEALIRGPFSAPSIPYRAISLCPRHESARASIAAFGALNAARAVPIRWYRPDARTTYTRSRAAWTRLLRARAALAPLVAECPACGTLFHRRVRAHLCAPPSCRLRESLLAAYSATEKTEPQLGIVADIERAYAAATRRA